MSFNSFGGERLLVRSRLREVFDESSEVLSPVEGSQKLKESLCVWDPGLRRVWWVGSVDEQRMGINNELQNEGVSDYGHVRDYDATRSR